MGPTCWPSFSRGAAPTSYSVAVASMAWRAKPSVPLCNLCSLSSERVDLCLVGCAAPVLAEFALQRRIRSAINAACCATPRSALVRSNSCKSRGGPAGHWLVPYRPLAAARTRASRSCSPNRRNKYYWAGLCLKNDPTFAKGEDAGAAGSTCVSRSPSSMPTIAISSFSSTATGWPAGTSLT